MRLIFKTVLHIESNKEPLCRFIHKKLSNNLAESFLFARKEGQEINEVADAVRVRVRPSIGVAPEGTLISPAALLAPQACCTAFCGRTE